MEFVTNIVSEINGIVWGIPMLVLILSVGLFLTVGLGFMPMRRIGYAFKMLWKGRSAQGEGDISPFNALMTSLSATIGTGNIAGVATAIFMGGPGALFWMWCTALVGMATKYSEAVLAVRYREVDKRGRYVGGPMYYIKNGLGKKWGWLGGLFAFFGAFAGFGIGNTVQVNSTADVLNSAFGIPTWVTGVVLMVLVGAVLLGGIHRIGNVAGKLIPFMATSYLIAGIIVLSFNAEAIPAAIALVFKHAFTPSAAEGGFAGAAVWMAMRYGVARGVFSNEAGLGSAPIAHASAATNSPVRQGIVSMLGTFIDTIIVCSITGLVILTSGDWTSGKTGATLSSMAFEHSLPGFGQYIVAIGLAVFAFTTIIGWSHYSERCVQFMFKEKSIKPFRALFVLVIPVGAIASLDFVWLLADTLNALMAVPNLIALALLSPVVFKLTKAYWAGDEEPMSGIPDQQED